MAAPEPNPQKHGDGKSKWLVLAMLGLVIGFIAAFLVFRPNPDGTGHPTSTSSHAPSSQ
jgi:hypothetical protein